jgi:regulator of replication initiation timing
MEIKNTVDAIVAENTTLSLKLNELQDKLATEKYVNYPNLG